MSSRSRSGSGGGARGGSKSGGARSGDRSYMSTRHYRNVPPPASSPQRSTFKDMAAVAGGVAVGSAVGTAAGNVITGAMTGGGGARQGYDAGGEGGGYTDPCAFQIGEFIRCAELHPQDLQACEQLNNALQICRKNNSR